jgi:hypothetical protein
MEKDPTLFIRTIHSRMKVNYVHDVSDEPTTLNIDQVVHTIAPVQEFVFACSAGKAYFI